ncbi:hypothetical protein ABBQ32_002421 [Trebouxia sp. C0010 RCD-2024]
MTTLLQALSDKARETRDQFNRVNVGSTAVSKAELPTTRGLSGLAESVQLIARDPIAAACNSSGLRPELDIVENHIDRDQARSKPASEPIIDQKEQKEPFQAPLSDRFRLYLLAFAAACLMYNHAGKLLQFFRTTGVGLLDLVAVVCLIAAAPAFPKTQMNETLQAVKLQAASAGVAVRALPQMSIEITAMLQEIRAMRHDLGNMAKKTAWLPGS